MSDRPDDLPLAAEFPAATREQWFALVERVLKGASFDTLASRTADGIRIEPLYERAASASPLAARAPGKRWQIMARVDHPDAGAANTLALDELNGGANGLLIVGSEGVGAHGYGLATAPAAIERVLEGVHLDAGLSIEFDMSANIALVIAALTKLQPKIAPGTLEIRFGYDPLSAASFGGGFPVPWPEFRQTAAQLIGTLHELGGPAARIAVADGRIVHAAGGTEAQELAYVIAVAVTYLRALETEGQALDTARRMLYFRLAADTDQFLTIAKFRALRKLWARIEQSCGLAPEPTFVAGETAWRTMTRNDPAVNILRATIATAAAGIGGADAITVLPFTVALGLPDAFARRIARNTQHLLLEEASLARVADPTAGTGWSEALTDELCHAAWALFQEIEAAGGTVAALERRLLQDKVAEARAGRERAIAVRKDVLVGASVFPDLDEAKIATLDVTRADSKPARDQFLPMRPLRLAEPYEALREASDRMLAANGARPQIFLANLGRPADFNARATFAKNFFEAGGIEAITNDGSETIAALVRAFKRSRATLACLCGDDKAYETNGLAVAQALRAAGLKLLYIAGRHLANTGADEAIHTGCDALAILRDAQAAA